MSEVVDTKAHPLAPLPLRALLAASLAMAVFTAGFGVQYTRDWKVHRAGKTELAQRGTLKGVAWFKRPFVRFATRLRATLPEGAKVLIEPSEIRTEAGDARWFLFLNYYAHPLEFYVRKPKWASGTLVDYPRWLAYHDKHPRRSLEEELAIEERGIEWLVRYPVEARFDVERVEVLKLEGGAWVPIELVGGKDKP